GARRTTLTRGSTRRSCARARGCRCGRRWGGIRAARICSCRRVGYALRQQSGAAAIVGPLAQLLNQQAADDGLVTRAGQKVEVGLPQLAACLGAFRRFGCLLQGGGRREMLPAEPGEGG